MFKSKPRSVLSNEKVHKTSFYYLFIKPQKRITVLCENRANRDFRVPVKRTNKRKTPAWVVGASGFRGSEACHFCFNDTPRHHTTRAMEVEDQLEPFCYWGRRGSRRVKHFSFKHGDL